MKKVSEIKTPNCNTIDLNKTGLTARHKSEENHGVISWTRWFRELRGKPGVKDTNVSKGSKNKDERRVRLNRTNSALPSNFKRYDHLNGENIPLEKVEKKRRVLDRRRYSFNGSSNTSSSQQIKLNIQDDRCVQKQLRLDTPTKLHTSRNSDATIVPIQSSSSYHDKQRKRIGGSESPRTISSSADKQPKAGVKFTHSSYRKIDEDDVTRIKEIEECGNLGEVNMSESRMAIDEEARSRERIYSANVENERIFVDNHRDDPCPADRDISLAKSASSSISDTLNQYSHSRQDSSYMSQEGDYAECYSREDRTLLTRIELERYTSDCDEHDSKVLHQKQPSYAQSEGYHSYVSSNDSAIITPLLNGLQRENDVIVRSEENIVIDRESSASSGSSSDTLKWHGSLSDVSVASGSYRNVDVANNVGYISNSQHKIVHSARVQTPQRHHSESVLYLDTFAVAQLHFHPQTWKDRANKAHPSNTYLRKLFPVNTYSVCPQPTSSLNSSTPIPDSPAVSAKPSVVKRVVGLEGQQVKPSIQQNTTKYTYLDPDKKHRVTDESLKVIQKKALLSYYERHHLSWKSEPQLSPVPCPPQPPRMRPRLPTPVSRKSSSASDCQDSSNEDESTKSTSPLKRDSSCTTSSNRSKCQHNNDFSSASMNQLDVGSMRISDAIAVDNWVPELPPKTKHLQMAFVPRRLPSPDLPPPPPLPPVEDDIFTCDDPLPPPPPEILSNSSSVVQDFSSKSRIETELEVPKILPQNAETVTSRVEKDTHSQRKTPEKDTNRNDCEFYRYSQHLYKNNLAVAEYCSRVEPEVPIVLNRPKEYYKKAVENKTDKLMEQLLLVNQSLRKSPVGKSAHTSSFVTTMSKRFEEMPKRNFDVKETDYSFSSNVLKHIETLPLQLNPQCPPTAYQLSQLSNQKEHSNLRKGLQTSVNNYKQAVLPSNPSFSYLRVGYNTNEVLSCMKSVSNVEKSVTEVQEDRMLVSDRHNKVGLPLDNNYFLNNSTMSSAIESTLGEVDTGTQVNFPSNHESKDCVKKLISEKKVGSSITTASKSSHTSSINGPSVVKNPSSPTYISSQSGTSRPNLHKGAGSNDSSLLVTGIPRSCLNLSTAGSVESGYSSLSLNITSPSLSPTCLSSINSVEQSNCSNSTDITQSVIVSDCINTNKCAHSEQLEDDSNKYEEIGLASVPLKSDAASQTDSYTAIVAHVEPELELDSTQDLLESSTSQEYNAGAGIKHNSQFDDTNGEEIICDILRLVPPDHPLQKLLAPQLCAKNTADYLKNVFGSNFIFSSPTNNHNLSIKQSKDNRFQEGSLPCDNFSYQLETTIKGENCNNRNCDKIGDKYHHLLHNQGKLLLTLLEQRLSLLKAKQSAILEDCEINDSLGEKISQKVVKILSPHEATKYELHIQEIGQVTSLLLGLSSRLAKVENSLSALTNKNTHEQLNLEIKRDKLLCQLEEAKALKTNIDKRNSAVSLSLVKYFSNEEITDYEYFIFTKCKLLINCREISEKIESCDLQLATLKELLSKTEH